MHSFFAFRDSFKNFVKFKSSESVIQNTVRYYFLFVLSNFSSKYKSFFRPIYTARTNSINCLKPSGYYMYHQFNIHKFYVLSTQCIYVFCVDLRTNSDYFPVQH